MKDYSYLSIRIPRGEVVGVSPEFQPRKLPQQERSKLLRRRILDASVRVLRDEGALGFTTTRVADEAGVSVGSLYQYFPNKHALVMAVHEADLADGLAHIESILDRSDRSPRWKLIEISVWFFTSEAEEAAQYGTAVGDIDVFLRSDADLNPALLADGAKRIARFISESSTRIYSAAELGFEARFLWTTIESIGKAVARQSPTPSATKRWATTTAIMIADHVHLPTD